VIRCPGHPPRSWQQFDETFYWSTPTADVNNAPLTANAPVNFALTVPPGIRVKPIMTGLSFNNATNNTITRIYAPDLADNNSVANQGNVAMQAVGASAAAIWAALNDVYTNTSQQVRAFTANPGTTLSIDTYGWIDHRGRFS
jgi:hypothetical protein